MVISLPNVCKQEMLCKWPFQLYFNNPSLEPWGQMINLREKKQNKKQNKNPARDKKQKSYLAHTLFYITKREERKATNWSFIQTELKKKIKLLKFSKLSVLNKHSSAMTPLTEIPEERQTHARLMSNCFHFVQVTRTRWKKCTTFTHNHEYSYKLYGMNTVLGI